MLDILYQSEAGVTFPRLEEAGDELVAGPTSVHDVTTAGLDEEHGDHLRDGDPGPREDGQDVSLRSALTQCGARDMYTASDRDQMQNKLLCVISDRLKSSRVCDCLAVALKEIYYRKRLTRIVADEVCVMCHFV